MPPNSHPPAPLSRSPALTGPADTWQAALRQLQGQMTRATFDRWLRGSQLLEAAGGVWVIGVRHPHAPAWLTRRLAPVIHGAVCRQAGTDVTLEYVVATPAPPPSPLPGTGAPGDLPDPLPLPQPCPPPYLASSPGRNPLLSFDPNCAAGGGFWMMGNYATWFWAALLGAVAWRVYELVVAGDKRRDKTLWTPPRRYSVSELARAVAAGREGRPNRDQIRGRYRWLAGERAWQPGAFDRLAAENIGRVEWHGGDGAWRPWVPGGAQESGRSGLRMVYRLSVATKLPLLAPRQAASLPAELQVAHERYLADRGLDLQSWEAIALPSLAGLDQEVITAATRQSLAPERQLGAG